MVHNLRRLDRGRVDTGFDWAQRFDEQARELMLNRPGEIAALAEHPDHALAVPTDEHLLPLLYVAGVAASTGAKVDVLTDGYAYGGLSMTSYTVGHGHNA